MPDAFLFHTDRGWCAFRGLQVIHAAHDLATVLPTLQRVEAAVEAHGWHAFGFISYDAAPAFDPALIAGRDPRLPLVWFGLFAACEPVDTPAVFPYPDPLPPLDWQLEPGPDGHATAIHAIRAEIAAGNTYQVNFTGRFSTTYAALPHALFTRLARQQHRYAAFLDTPEWAICSASHELFFALDGEQVTCRPMKGTAPRGPTPDADIRLADGLQASVKDQAENLMIVDMVRNDLGRVAHPGSVAAPALFQLERYPTLYQMTSTVTARTAASVTDLLQALFPSASITGAPKVSTMRLINRLEHTPRGLYTGAIGHVAPGRHALFNVAIRTAVVDKMQARAVYGVGGGITWDSRAEAEYAEAVLKADVLRAPDTRPYHLFETLRFDRASGYWLLDRHADRLIEGALQFGFTRDATALRAAFLNHADQLARDPACAAHPTIRVRIQLNADGTLESRWTPLAATPSPFRVCLAPGPVDPDHPFLRHKTSVRDMYADPARLGVDDVLHWNTRQALTEFSIGNLVLVMAGERLTPPVSAGLLPGTFRAELLSTGEIREQTLTRDDLARAEQVFLINAVRGWVPVALQGSPRDTPA
ncbi:MAG: aminodeoxychorismate synthase component I [Gammaproteobacteria bacterium]